jgi:hypothetical protein
MVKDRYSDKKIDELTVEIGQGYRYYGFERVVHNEYLKSRSINIFNKWPAAGKSVNNSAKRSNQGQYQASCT